MRLEPGTLRAQLTLAFLIVALLPAGALAFFIAWSAQRALRLSALEHNGQLAVAVAAEISRHLEGQVLHLQGVEYAVEAWQARGERAGLPAAPRLAVNPATQAVLLLDLRGHVVGVDPPDRDLQGIDLSRLPFLAAARQSGRPTWSSVTLSPRTGRPSIALALPGATRTLVEYLDLAVLKEIVLRVRSQRQAEVMVVDSAGTILGAQDEGLVRERENVGDLALVREALAGRPGTDEVALRGRRQLASAAPVALTGWAVVAAQPADEAFALVSRIRDYVLAAFVLASVVAMAVAVLLSRRLRRPIDALAEAAQAVAGGRYDLALPRGALAETDALAGSFATMAAAIEERERARREADRHYRNVVATPLLAVLRTGPDGRVIFCNEAAARLVGWPTVAAGAGREAAGLFADAAEWGRLQAALRRGDRVVNRELLLGRPDGRRPVEVLANATADGEEVTLLMLDVSEERRAAAELQRLEQELQRAQRLEALGRLAGGVAHDFNNLLTVIIGLATELAELEPGAPAHEAAEGILQAARRGTRLTQSLLAYGRKQALKPRPADLRQVVEEAMQLAGRVLGQQVVPAVVLPEEPVPAVVDPGQLEQVLLNLCTNARDAMPGGGLLTVELTTEVITPAQATDWGLGRSGRYARIDVRDTGQGMSPEVRARIFEPFFTTKELGKGTGLGLAIVYGIVRQHEGHVQVRSTPNEGTVFSILLPLGAGLQAVAPAPPEAQGDARAVPGQEVVLLADDDVLVRRVMRSILERGGYRVLEAIDGEQAVELFTAHGEAVDLCVFDVAMPRRNGLEARARVRELRPGLPVLLVSGYAADVLDSAGPGADVPELMGKPVVPQELLAKVRELLERARSGEGSAAGRASLRAST